MARVSDCAGSEDGSPITPTSVWPSASHNGVGTPEDLISQLDGWPACAPVNASPAPLPVRTHDSGSGRLAGSSPYGSFIRNSSPVFNGALNVQEIFADVDADALAGDRAHRRFSTLVM